MLFITILAVPMKGFANLASNIILMSFVSQSKPMRMIFWQNTKKILFLSEDLIYHYAFEKILLFNYTEAITCLAKQVALLIINIEVSKL